MPVKAMMNKFAPKPRHILIVDDEWLVRQSLKIFLQDDGYVVHEAQSGAEALALFEPSKFDMVFIDYFMPGMKGDQLALAVKQRSPNQPVVMITAYPERLQSLVNPAGGADSVICKPFGLDNLRAALAVHASP